MTNMNALIRKVYLLAGVVMAANIFVGNEMKAMDKDKIVFEIEGIGNEGNTIGVNNNNKMIFLPKIVLETQLETFYFWRIILTFLAH